MFPQDHQFDKDDLVRMWVSLGFIHSSDLQGETLTDIGRRYFNILVQKSFFEEFDSDDKVHYKMHDLLHELAESVSKQEYLRVVDDKQLSNCSKTIRHLSIYTGRLNLNATLNEIEKFKNLRSVFLFERVDINVISKILKAWKSIRLLVVSPYNYNLSEDLSEALRKAVGCLIYLRYLKVTSDLKLPRSISHLYHLQFIISHSLEKLEMDNISWKACNRLQGCIRNCSSIYFRNSPILIHLTGRQELKLHENCQLITNELVIKDPSVLLMEPLRSISSLRSLTIEENNFLVSFPAETEQWFSQHSSSLWELVFYKLGSLQSLPSSLESLSSLARLEVSSLASLQCLPSSLSTFSSLKYLKLVNIPLLKSLPELPPSLSSLFLSVLENLDRLPSRLPTTLSALVISKVPRPLALPELPASLESLRIEDCHPQLMQRQDSFTRRRNLRGDVSD